MPNQVNIDRIRNFYNDFFNKCKDEAFDELASPDYCHNGIPSSGAALKLLKADWCSRGVEVCLLDILEEEDVVEGKSRVRYAVIWQAKLRPKGAPKDAPKSQIGRGVNVLIFNDLGKVRDNYHAQAKVNHAWECPAAESVSQP